MKDYIGNYVKKFESGDIGSVCLESCGYDWGLSAGTYQLTLRWGNCINFLKKYFPNESKDLYFNIKARDIKTKEWPGKDYSSSPDEVRKVWLECYNKVGAEKFFECEHDNAKTLYYDKIKEKILDYIDLDNSSRAFQELFWAWSLNVGVNGAYQGFQRALSKLKYKINSHEELLDACYDDRFEIKGTNRYKRGVANNEREVTRALLNVKGIGVSKITSPLVESQKKKKITNYIGKVTGGSVYIRKGPGKDYPVKATVKKDQKVRITIEQNGWGYILLHGWISLKYVEKV